MLPRLNDTSGTIVADPDPALRAMLAGQREKMIERIAILEQNRDALTRHIAATDSAAAATAAASSTAG